MMQKLFRVAPIAAALLVASPAAAAAVSGAWVAEIDAPGGPQFAHVILRSEGGKLAGTWGRWHAQGTATGDTVDLSLTDREHRMIGTLSGINGSAGLSGKGTVRLPRRNGVLGESEEITWTLKRPPERPEEPKTWNFDPKVFYPYYSAKNPPALRIFPGDTVHTWTVDASGYSPKLERLAWGPDSTAGPFYVEGALPGDTLVVRLDRVRLNRDSAHQGNRINPRAVTPAFAAASRYAADFNSQWKLDASRGIATLAYPTERMKNFTVPILPMIGCLAVAPEGDEVYRGTDLGAFGGNLDYNQNGEGTTLYFPVFHPGGLFVLGDGHAAMGDGELTGSALETSLDVDFTVDVIRGYATPQPRAENKDYLMSFGVAGSVADAIQIATSQLADWLKRDYHLNDNEVAVLLGTVLKYDITELVDPKFDVVAKVPKSSLAAFK